MNSATTNKRARFFERDGGTSSGGSERRATVGNSARGIVNFGSGSLIDPVTPKSLTFSSASSAAKVFARPLFHGGILFNVLGARLYLGRDNDGVLAGFDDRAVRVDRDLRRWIVLDVVVVDTIRDNAPKDRTANGEQATVVLPDPANASPITAWACRLDEDFNIGAGIDGRADGAGHIRKADQGLG